MTATDRYNEWRFQEEEGYLTVTSCEDRLTLDIERTDADGTRRESHYQYVQATDSVDEQVDTVRRTGPHAWCPVLAYCADPAASHYARLVAELGSAIYTGAQLAAPMTEWQVPREALQ